MSASVKKNFFFQIIYQTLLSILPFVTSPHVARAFGADGLGTYTFSFAIVNYFGVFAGLGIGLYGNRLIASVRDDPKALNRSFSSLYTLHLIIYAFVLSLYLLYASFLSGELRTLAYIQTLILIGGALDVGWLYFGLEKFKITVTNNCIIKIASVVCILTFVRSREDLLKYAAILAIANCLNHAVLWTGLHKYVKWAPFSMREMMAHLGPLLTLFVADLAISVYSYMDKIMMGYMSSTSELGYYENAWKMIEFPVGFILALGTVMLPKISNLQKNGKHREISNYIYKSFRFSVMMALAILFGLLAIADDFSVIFWGEGFRRCGALIKIMSVSVLLMAWNAVVRQQYLIPTQMNRAYLRAVCAGAVVNLILNAWLIPAWGAAGAAIATVCAYFAIFVVQNYATKGNLKLHCVIRESIPYAIIGLAMCYGISLLKSRFATGVLLLIFEVLLGVAIFGLGTVLYAVMFRDSFVLEELHKLLGRLFRKGE